MPLGMQIHPDGRHLFITNIGKGTVSLIVLDVENGKIVSNIQKDGYFLGLAFSPDGQYVYVSGGGRAVIETYRFEPETGSLSPIIDLTMSVPGFAAGISTTQDGSLLLAVAQLGGTIETPGILQIPGTLCIFDTQTGALVGQTPTGLNPYTVAVNPNPNRPEAYVSNELSNSVTVFDFDISDSSHIQPKATVQVQKNPEALSVSMDGSRLYVTNADEDSVSIIDTVSSQPVLLQTLDLRAIGTSEYGSSPNALAFSRTGTRLYVAQAGQNKIAVIDTDKGIHIGDIPTAWYPTSVCIYARQNEGVWKETLYVADGKGIGTPGLGDMGHVPGAISVLPVPEDSDLDRLTSLAEENNAMPGKLFSISDGYQNPVPIRKEDATPIKHVFFVVRENKTYDVLLGAYQPPVGEADGDPQLTMKDHDTILPNLYRLAERFAIGDNYYSNAEASNQGHEMLTASTVNTYVEKLVFATNRPIPIELEMVFSPVTWPKKEFIFQNALNKKPVLSFRDYGEAVGAGKDLLLLNEQWVHRGKYDPPFFWILTKDADKMAERINEWESPGFSGENFPRLVFMLLPDDHTLGKTFPMPTPESMIADNDEATGIFVEWLSHSPYWKESVAFITEDDPQQGEDHVDPHRTILLVVSPWVRQGYVSHVKYSEANLYATIEHILGLPPMTIFDAVAQPMYDLFTFEGNDKPFEHTPRIWKWEINPPGTQAAEQSASMNFSEPDEAEGLSDALEDVGREKGGAQGLIGIVQSRITRLRAQLAASLRPLSSLALKGEQSGPSVVLRQMVLCARRGDLTALNSYLDGSLPVLLDAYHHRRQLLSATVASQDPVSDLASVFNRLDPIPLNEEITGERATVTVQYKDAVSARFRFVRERGQWKFLLSGLLAPSVRMMNDSFTLWNAFQRGSEIVDDLSY
jgi:DNA-binding beta-propeller fold protein YncE